MGIVSWLFYIISGFVLFFIMMYLENKFSINKVQNIIFSVIYMMILGGITSRYGYSNLNGDIFLIFVFTFIMAVIYINYVLERDFFDKSHGYVKFYIVLIVIGYIINQEFINRVDCVFLTGDDLRLVLWFGAFIFIYQFIRDNNLLKDGNISSKKFNMSNQSIVVSYAKLKYKFLNDINYDNKDLVLVLYSIMIYENNKKSSLMRKFDNFMFRLDGNSRKLGIMQVNSKKFISDIESIDLVYKKLEKLYNKKNKTVKKINYKDIIELYDKDNFDDICIIYDCICKI